MERPPTHAVHEGHRDQCHGDHDGSDAYRHELGRLLCEPRTDEQPRRVVEHLYKSTDITTATFPLSISQVTVRQNVLSKLSRQDHD